MLVFTYTANPLRMLDLAVRRQSPGLRLTALVDRRLEPVFSGYEAWFDRVYYVPVDYVTHCFVPAFTAAAIDAVADEVRRCHGLTLVSFFEGDIEATAGLRDRFGLPGMTAAEARRFRDKLVMKQAVRDLGYLVPDAVPLDTSRAERELFSACIAELGLPFLVKPVALGGSLGVQRVASGEDFDSWDRRRLDTPYFAEAEIAGQLLHLDLVVDDDGGLAWFGCSEYNASTLAFGPGRAVGSKAIRPPPTRHGLLRDWAVDVAASLGMQAGVVHIEAIQGDDGLFFIEAAARASGGLVTVVYRKMFGYNMIQADVARRLGVPYRADPPDGLAYFWVLLPDGSEVSRNLGNLGITTTTFSASAGPQVRGSLIGRYDTLLASHPDYDYLHDAFRALV